jgi:hypothetical protein
MLSDPVRAGSLEDEFLSGERDREREIKSM